MFLLFLKFNVYVEIVVGEIIIKSSYRSQPESKLAGRQAGRYGQSPFQDSGFRRVRLKHNLNFNRWNSHVHRGFPGKFESTNLSRDDLSGEIGRRRAGRQAGRRAEYTILCHIIVRYILLGSIIVYTVML